MRKTDKEQEVRHYYDRNTFRFLRLARRSAPQAIHQPLYVHEQMTLEDALHTPHKKILELLSTGVHDGIILDLGCGVGESILYMAKHTPVNFKYYGITISGNQARNASSRISLSGLSARIQIIEGSFQSLPSELPSIDLAYAIESFVHSPDPSEFFSQVSAKLKRGGQLILFDDFLRKLSEDQSDMNILSDLKTGWLANTLLTSEQVTNLAVQAGFRQESNTDLSGMLSLHRLRDTFIHLLAPLARLFLQHSQYCRFLVGGDARQRAYQRGLLQYAMLVFVKR